ncbi:MAG: chorismate mutase, partial [Gammaproteobacteria bacterium]
MEKIKAESLEHARQQIDAIDTALVELIAARQFYVDQTTRFKKT